MIVTLLGVYIVIVGLMTLTFLRSQACQKYKLQIASFRFLSSVATYIKEIMQNMICVTGVYSREIIDIFFIGQVSGLVKNFNIGIYSDTI